MASVYPNAGITAARIVSDDGTALAAGAARVRSAVLSVAAAHRRTGDYMRSIQTRIAAPINGVRDHVVATDDPAALAIEYGHFSGTVRKSGRRVTTTTLRRVPGQHIFSKAKAAL